MTGCNFDIASKHATTVCDVMERQLCLKSPLCRVSWFEVVLNELDVSQSNPVLDYQQLYACMGLQLRHFTIMSF